MGLGCYDFDLEMWRCFLTQFNKKLTTHTKAVDNCVNFFCAQHSPYAAHVGFPSSDLWLVQVLWQACQGSVN